MRRKGGKGQAETSGCAKSSGGKELGKSKDQEKVILIEMQSEEKSGGRCNREVDKACSS